MKKQIISFTLVAAGFLVGASALSALAQTSGWTAPHNAPPTCDSSLDPGCLAPINVGPNTVRQVKNDSLQINGALGVSSDLIVGGIASTTILRMGPTSIAGQVMTAVDGQGTVGWSTPNRSLTCVLALTTTTGDAAKGSGAYSKIPVPSQCIDSICDLFFTSYSISNDSLTSRSLRAVSLIQVSDAQKIVHSRFATRWIKLGGTDGTDCDRGINGDTNSCAILKASGDLKIMDDYAPSWSSAFDTSPDYWTVENDPDNLGQLYVCN